LNGRDCKLNLRFRQACLGSKFWLRSAFYVSATGGQFFILRLNALVV